MDCPYLEREVLKNRLCVKCKNFVCTYRYGYAREDPSYIEIRCNIFVESDLKRLDGSRGKEYKWDIGNRIGWNTQDFLKTIEIAKECGFYEEIV